MFNRILVATDSSKNAKAAVSYAAQLAGIAGSQEVLVVHVCPACTADLDPDDTNRKLAEAIVRESGDVISKTGVDTRLMVEADYPPEAIGSAIADIAGKEGADLVILGSRGLSEVKGLLLGSVSNKVLQRAACPVLVVKSGE